MTRLCKVGVLFDPEKVKHQVIRAFQMYEKDIIWVRVNQVDELPPDVYHVVGPPGTLAPKDKWVYWIPGPETPDPTEAFRLLHVRILRQSGITIE